MTISQPYLLYKFLWSSRIVLGSALFILCTLSPGDLVDKHSVRNEMLGDAMQLHSSAPPEN